VTGRPYVARVTTGLRRPRSGRVGVDLAGTVEAVGKAVTKLRPGDEADALRYLGEGHARGKVVVTV
jgi:hypothetical protein